MRPVRDVPVEPERDPEVDEVDDLDEEPFRELVDAWPPRAELERLLLPFVIVFSFVCFFKFEFNVNLFSNPNDQSNRQTRN